MWKELGEALGDLAGTGERVNMVSAALLRDAAARATLPKKDKKEERLRGKARVATEKVTRIASRWVQLRTGSTSRRCGGVAAGNNCESRPVVTLRLASRTGAG